MLNIDSRLRFYYKAVENFYEFKWLDADIIFLSNFDEF